MGNRQTRNPESAKRPPEGDDSKSRTEAATSTDKLMTDACYAKLLADQGPEAIMEVMASNHRVHASDLKSWIINAYRDYYEELAVQPQQSVPPYEVITDFVAAYPALVFESEWVRNIVEIQVGNRDFRDDGPRNTLFHALSLGFRRVANPEARVNESIRDAQREAAFYARGELQKELKSWHKSLEPSSATARWMKEQVDLKVAGLLASEPRLAPERENLAELLFDGAIYEASNLIVSTIYAVPIRVLQTTRR